MKKVDFDLKRTLSTVAVIIGAAVPVEIFRRGIS
jgi:hypothetical protein